MDLELSKKSMKLELFFEACTLHSSPHYADEAVTVERSIWNAPILKLGGLKLLCCQWLSSLLPQARVSWSIQRLHYALDDSGFDFR